MKKIFILVFFVYSQLGFGQIINSDFENGTSNWTDDTNLTISEETLIVHNGVKSLNCTFDSQTQANCDLRSDLIPGITEGNSYTVSAWFYDNDSSGRANLVIEWYDNSNNLLSTNYYSSYTEDLDTWQQLSYTVTSPTNAAKCKVGTRFYDVSATWDGDCTIYVDDFDGTPEPLPVELTSFTAFVNASSIKLSWNTATEINNYGFEVERTQMPSAKSQADWKNIGFVQGNGNSNSPKTYSFVDKSLSAGKYFYRLKQIDNDGQYEYSKTVEVNYGSMPNGFVLEQNYPNPFNPGTSIKFSFADNTQAALVVYNAIGQQVAELFNGTAEAGRVYDVRFDASTLSSGIYFYKLQSDKNSEIKKMILLR